MNNCEHNVTKVVSLDTAYYVECLDCGDQFSEQEASDLDEAKALQNDYLEAMVTGN